MKVILNKIEKKCFYCASEILGSNKPRVFLLQPVPPFLQDSFCNAKRRGKKKKKTFNFQQVEKKYAKWEQE